MTKFLLSALLWGLLMGSTGELRAEIMVEVRNNTGGQAYISFAYHDVISDSPITRGWWEVPSVGSRTIRVNTDKDELIWFAYNERGLAWGGEENDAQSEYRHVVQENFFVKDGWKPRGAKHMRIFMKKAVSGDKRLFLDLRPASSNTSVAIDD